jgi:hypothetical protein
MTDSTGESGGRPGPDPVKGTRVTGAGQGSWLLIQIAELVAVVAIMKVFYLAVPHASRSVQWVVFALVLAIVMVGAYATRRYLRRSALPGPRRPDGL